MVCMLTVCAERGREGGSEKEGELGRGGCQKGGGEGGRERETLPTYGHCAVGRLLSALPVIANTVCMKKCRIKEQEKDDRRRRWIRRRRKERRRMRK